MAISKEKTRVIISINKEDKKKLEEQAKKKNRSVSNLIATLIKNYLENV